MHNRSETSVRRAAAPETIPLRRAGLLAYTTMMYIGTWKPLQRLFRQRRFANLMDVYERNYGLLLRIAPQLPWGGVDGRACGRVGPVLYLELAGQHRYTTDIRLTHYLQTGGYEPQHRTPRAIPDLLLRACHDSRQLEMLGRAGRLSRSLSGCVEGASELDRRWAASLFLERWLTYCLNQGYCFAPQYAASAAPRTAALAKR